MRSGPYMCSGKRRTLAQMKPAVSGLSCEPSTPTTRPPSTFTSRLQASGQSSGQIERSVSAAMRPRRIPRVAERLGSSGTFDESVTAPRAPPV